MYDDRLFKKRFGNKWHMMDEIKFGKTFGEIMKYQRIFVVELLTRKEFESQLSQINKKPKYKYSDMETEIWCLKLYKLDQFADVEVLPALMINLGEYKLIDDLIKT